VPYKKQRVCCSCVMRTNPFRGPLEGVGTENRDFFGPFIWQVPRNLDFQGLPLPMALEMAGLKKVLIFRTPPLNGPRNGLGGEGGVRSVITSYRSPPPLAENQQRYVKCLRFSGTWKYKERSYTVIVNIGPVIICFYNKRISLYPPS
jgi:hypothetical protein